MKMQQAIENLKQEVTDARNELNDKMDVMEINLRCDIEAIRTSLNTSSSDDEEE